MKKFTIALLFLVSVFAISCEIGLGAAVDTDPPTLDISTPPVDAVIRDKFAIAGNWTDDGTIASVKVKLERTDGLANSKSHTFDAEFKELKVGKGTWKYVIDPVAEEVIDGSYQATITIADSTNRKTIVTRTFTIDNTPPIIVLTRPSTAKDLASPDKYGQKFTLEGQAADTNNISRIELKLFTDKECTQPVNDEPVVLKNVPLSISMDAADYDSKDENYIYNKGETEEFSINVPKDGTGKQLYCKIYAYDGAARYADEDETVTEDDEKGNCAEYFYLYKNIYTPFLQYYKITELYSILNGTFGETASREAAPSPSTVKTDYLLSDDYQQKVSSFILNPKNNPTYIVTGRSPLALDGTDFTGVANDITTGQSVIVEVSPGLDDIPLDETSLKVYAQEIVFNKDNTYVIKDEKIYPDATMESKGSSYRFNVRLSRSDEGVAGLKIGKTYVFGVEGKDQSNNKVEADGGKPFGFRLAASGNAPSLIISTPQATTTYIPKNETQTFEGYVEVEMGTPKVLIYKDTDEDDNLIQIIDFEEEDAVKISGGLHYDFSFTYDDFGNENGIHKFIFKADLSGQLSQLVEKTIVYDIAAPSIEISKVVPSEENIIKYDLTKEDGTTIDGNYLNGDMQFTIVIIDDYDVVANAWYKINDGEKIAIDSPVRSILSIDTTEYTDLSNFKLTIIANDRAGNENSLVKEYQIDQSTDKPVILPGDPENISFKFSTKVAFEEQSASGRKGIATTSTPVAISLHDDDGISSLVLKRSQKITSDSDAITWTQEIIRNLSQPSFRMPEDGGLYKFELIATDKNGLSTSTGVFVLNAARDAATITDIKSTPEYRKGVAGQKFVNKISGINSAGPYKLYRQIIGIDNDFVPVEGKQNESQLPIQDEIDVSLLLDGSGKPVADEIDVYYYVVDGTPRDSNKNVKTVLYIDDDKPTITIKSPAENKTGKAALTETTQFTGKADDEKSGVTKIFYKFTDTSDSTIGDYIEMEASNGSYAIDKEFIEKSKPESEKDGKLEEGKWYFHIFAEDEAGNQSDVMTRAFDIDFENPNISASINKYIYNNTDITAGKGSFTMSGTASDTHGLTAVKVYIKEVKSDGTTPVEKVLDVPVSGIGSDNAWSKTIVFGSNENTSATNYLAEGKYEIWAEATDKVGKTQTTEKKQITIDYTAPIIHDTENDTTLKLNDVLYDINQWYESKTLKVDVVVTDDVSGVSTVQCITVNKNGGDRVSPLSLDENDNWTGSAQLASDGAALTITLNARDAAGNLATPVTKTVKVDTSAPTLEVYKYKIGNDGTLKTPSGTVYINNTSQLIVYGNFTDDESGVRPLGFEGTTNGADNKPQQPTVTYSNAVAGDTNDSYTISTLTDSNRKTVKSWKAVFTNGMLGTDTLKVYGYNAAGAEGLYAEKNMFAISRDTTKPTFDKLNFTTDSDHFTVYAKKASNNTTVENYYINNTKGTFIISGLTDDSKPENAPVTEGPASGVELVKLEIEDAASHKYSETASTAYFANINLSSFDTSATAKLTVYDYAGNFNEYTLPGIIFDNAGPRSVHKVDATGKDLIFRVGDGDNSDITDTTASLYSLAWDTYTETGDPATEDDDEVFEDIDTKAGGKYAGGSFTNAQTIKVRGDFEDSGSGLKQVFYKLYDRNNSLIFDNGVEKYNLTETEKTALVEDVVNANQYFAPLSEDEYKRVFYNVKKGDTDTYGGKQLKKSGNPVVEKKKLVNGNFVDAGEDDTGIIEFYKYWKLEKATYSFTIPQLKEGCNYLVIVAEDNVGNYYIDTSDPIDHDNNPATPTRTYVNYSMNLDTTPPKIELNTPANTAMKYAKASYTVKIKVTDPEVDNVTNSSSGIKSVVLTCNDVTVPCTLSTAAGEVDIWTADVASLLKDNDSVTITAIATDIAKTSSEKVVANIFKDNNPPSVTIDTNSINDADATVTGIQVNGTISLKGTAEDVSGGSGLKVDEAGSKTLKLYYTKDSTLGGKAASAITTSDIGETAASKFKLLRTTENTASWEFTNLNTANLEGTGTSTAIADNTPIYFMVATEDKSGNIGYSTPQAVIVNQDTDRPQITLMQIEKNNSTTLLSTDVLGSISDDDGTTGLKLWYSDGSAPAAPSYVGTDWVATGWTEIPINGTSWTCNLSGDNVDGQKNWYFAVGDAAKGVFVTSAALKPYIKYYNQTSKEDNSSPIQFKVDTNAPVISSIALLRTNVNTATVTASTEGWTETTNNLEFGGTYKYLYAKVIVTEKTAMDATTPLTCSYLGTISAGNVTPSNNQYTYIVGPFDLSGKDTGTPSLSFTVKDAVGKTASESKTINVDFGNPVLTISNPDDKDSATGIQVNGKKTIISGTATDENNISKITLTAKSGTGDSEKEVVFKYPAPGSITQTQKALTFTDNKNWSAELDTTYLYNGTDAQALTLSVSAEDNFGNIYNLPYTAPAGGLEINQNSDRPEIKMNQVKRDGTGYITSTTVYGSIKDDDNQISRLWVWSKKNNNTAPSSAPSLNGENTGWVEFGAEETKSTIENNNWQIDSSEGDGETTWYWAVADANAATDADVFWTGAESELKRPYISYKDSTEKDDNTSGVTFKYDTKSPEINSVQLIRFETDLYNEDAATSNVRYSASEIEAYMNKQTPKPLQWSSENNISFGKDKALMYVKVQVTEETGMDSTTPIKEKDNYLDKFKDVGSGQTEVYISHTENTSIYTYILGPYDLSKEISGSAITTNYTLNFVATDMATKTGTKEKPITIDNNAEITIKNITPKLANEQTGEFTFSGEVEDSMSTIQAMSYHIPVCSSWNGKTDEQKESYMDGLTGTNDWTPIEDVSTSWRVDFVNFAIDQLNYTIESNNESHIDSKYEAYNIKQDGLDTGVYDIPVCFKVTDEVGNVGYIWKGKYDKGENAEDKEIKIRFNPNTDRPSVVITDPEATDEGVLKSGNVTISGTATDDEGVKAVYVQIAKNGDTTFAENNLVGGDKLQTIPTKTWKGLLATGTKNWKLSLNISSFDTDEILLVRAIAVDNDEEATLVSTWSTVTKIKVNNTIPFFGSNHVNRYATGSTTAVPSREYNSDIYVKNENGYTWYLEGEVSTPVDDNFMKEFEITLNNEAYLWTGNKTSIAPPSGNSNPATITGTTVTYSGQQTLKYKIPVSSENLDITVRVKDNTSGTGGQSTESFKVSVDDTNPSFPDMYKADPADTEDLGIKLYRDEYGKASTLLNDTSQLLQNSNGSKFILAGKITEAGSGFDKAVFYFKRGTGANARIYNVMEAHGSDNQANKIAIASSSTSITTVKINGDNLPVRTLTLSKVTDHNDKFTNNELKDKTVTVGEEEVTQPTNPNIRVGGLVKLGGLYRTITAIDGTSGEITITPEYTGDDMSAEFVYAMVVDHEGEREDSDGSLNSSSDDGDKMYETYDGNKSSGYNWTAKFNSANIPDGPIEIHVVAFDKAGNVGHGYIKTRASNNAPRITKVMLGTDLNGNGKFDYGTGEFKTFYQDTDDDGKPLTKTGVQNWDLDTSKEFSDDEDGNPVYWKVKSGIAVIPEFVGGVGPFYWQMSRGSDKITSAGTIPSDSYAGREMLASGANDLIVRKVTTDSGESYENATWSYSSNKVDGETVQNYGGSLAIEATDALLTTNAATYEDQVVYYSFTFWDSTEDSTPGTDTGWTILNAKVKQDLTDGNNPVSVIKPFEWTGTGYTIRTIVTEDEVEKSDVTDVIESLSSGQKLGTTETTVIENGKITTTKVTITPKNSLYATSKENGHIELEADVANNNLIKQTKVGDNKTLGDDAKVSGKITFHGTAYDDTRLSSIWFKFADFTASNSLAASGHDAVTGMTGYAQAAWYNPETAKWESASASMASDSWEMNVSDIYFDQTGHKVDWYLSINTALITSQVGIDKALSIRTKDHAGKISSDSASASNVSATSDAKYSKPVYSMDVVPYIRKISTPNRRKSGLKDANIRSASGNYSIIKDTTDAFILIEGFNLNPGEDEICIVTSDVVDDADVTKDSGVTVTRSAEASDGYTRFTVSNDLSNSGYLEVFTNGIRALNNINTTEAYGSYTLTGKKDSNGKPTATVNDYKYSYNREADFNTTKNVMLTDDRYLMVWSMHDTGNQTRNGYYPTLIMEGDKPVFGYLNQSGGRNSDVGTAAGTGAGKNYASYAMAQRAKFDENGDEVYIEYLAKNSVGNQFGMARDASGRFHHISVFDRDKCAMWYVYDRYAELYGTGSGWAPGVGISKEDGATNWNYLGSPENNGLALETVNYSSLMTGRYMYPKMVASGNSKTGTASVYVAYYDDNTHEILVRNFMVGKSDGTYVSDGNSVKFTRIYDDENKIYYYYSTTKNLTGHYVKYNNNYYLITYYGSDDTYGYYRINNSPNIGTNAMNTYSIATLSGSSVKSMKLDSSHKDSSGETYSQAVNFSENSMTSTANYNEQLQYDTGRIQAVGTTEDTKPSKYFDMKVTSDNRIVIVYYDEVASALKLMYSTSEVTGSNPTEQINFDDSGVSFPEYVGNYVSLGLDSNNGMHITGFDANDSDLYYMYVGWNSTDHKPQTSLKKVRVDQYGSVGHWTQVRIDTTSTHASSKYYNKPVIAYYNSTETGGRDSIKLAYFTGAITDIASATEKDPTIQGVDSNGYTTGVWEYMTVPAITPPQGGDPKFQNVCLDFDEDGDPVVGYLATNIEFGKQLPEAD